MQLVDLHNLNDQLAGDRRRFNSFLLLRFLTFSLHIRCIRLCWQVRSFFTFDSGVLWCGPI